MRDVLPEIPVKKLGLDEERFLFAELLASAPQVTLSWPLASDEGRPCARSSFVERLRWGGVFEKAAVARSVLAPAPAGSAQRLGLEEHLLRAALLGPARSASRRSSRSRCAGSRARSSTGGLRRRRAPSRRRASPCCARWKGRRSERRRGSGPYFGFVGPQRAANDPRAARLYVTTLERLSRCGWQTFLERLLRLEAPPDAGGALPGIDARLLGIGGPPRDRRGLRPAGDGRRRRARSRLAGPTTRSSRRSRPRPPARFSRRRASRSRASRACSRSRRSRSWCVRAASTRPSRCRSRSWRSSASAASRSPTRGAARTLSTSGPIASSASTGASGSRTSRPGSRSRTRRRTARAASTSGRRSRPGRCFSRLPTPARLPLEGKGRLLYLRPDLAAGAAVYSAPQRRRGARQGVRHGAARALRRLAFGELLPASAEPRSGEGAGCLRALRSRAGLPARRHGCASASLRLARPGRSRRGSAARRRRALPAGPLSIGREQGRRRGGRLVSDPARAAALRSADAAVSSAAQRVFDRPFVVEAGAGTGKTTLLVARCLAWALGPGWKLAEDRLGAGEPDGVAAEVLSRVAAITFTEAAAAEMANRLGEVLAEIAGGKLRAGIDAGSADRSGAAARGARPRAARRARPLGGAHDPRVLPSSARAASARRRPAPRARGRRRPAHHARGGPRGGGGRRARGVRRARGSGPDRARGRRVRTARSWRRRWSRFSRRRPPRARSTEAVFTPELIAPMLEELRAALDRFAAADGGRLEKTNKSSSKTREALDAIDATAQQLSGCSASVGSLDVLAEAVRGHWSKNALERLRDWDGPKGFNASETKALGDFAPAVKEAAAGLRAALERVLPLRPLRLERARRALHALLSRAREKLRERGAIGYASLLREARDLLRDQPAVRARVRSDFDQLLVDEFQDTDPVQCEIVRLLALGDDPRSTARPLPGRRPQAIDLRLARRRSARLLLAGRRCARPRRRARAPVREPPLGSRNPRRSRACDPARDDGWRGAIRRCSSRWSRPRSASARRSPPRRRARSWSIGSAGRGIRRRISRARRERAKPPGWRPQRWRAISRN